MQWIKDIANESALKNCEGKYEYIFRAWETAYEAGATEIFCNPEKYGLMKISSIPFPSLTEGEVEKLAAKFAVDLGWNLKGGVITNDIEKAFLAGYKASLQDRREVEEALLLKIIDVAWNECTESKEVPSTKWAKEIIEKAKASLTNNKPTT